MSAGGATQSEWDQALVDFEEHLCGLASRKRGGKPILEDTRRQYVQAVTWVATSIGHGPWDVGPRELGDWMDGQRWSKHRRKKVMTSLRTFYAWAVEEGRTEWAPVAGLHSGPNPRNGRLQRTEFTHAWVEPGWSYLASMRAAKRSEGTIDVRRLDLLKLSEVAADPWLVTTRQLQLWLSNPDWGPATARRARGSVRQFYRWALLEGRIAASPAAGLESIRVPRNLPRPVPDGPLRAALAAADDRVRLALMFGALGGLRRAEIAALHTRHVSQSEIFVTGKAGKQRRVPMHPLLWSELSIELERRRDGRHGTGWHGPFVTAPGYLFPRDTSPEPTSPRWLGVLMSQALPADWASHSLRHRFATMAYLEQRDLLAVQQLLGHSKPETTAVYAQVPDGALRTAVLSVGL